jgi:hypothetical protein
MNGLSPSPLKAHRRRRAGPRSIRPGSVTVRETRGRIRGRRDVRVHEVRWAEIQSRLQPGELSHRDARGARNPLPLAGMALEARKVGISASKDDTGLTSSAFASVRPAIPPPEMTTRNCFGFAIVESSLSALRANSMQSCTGRPVQDGRRLGAVYLAGGVSLQEKNAGRGKEYTGEHGMI